MKRQPFHPPPFRLHRAIQKRGAIVAMHAHDEAQLTFVTSGMVQILTTAGQWLVPPQLAVWAPAGVPHRVEVLSLSEFWIIYWRPSVVEAWAPSRSLGRAFALRVTPLLKALIAAAFAADVASDRTELIIKLILHELIEAPDAPTFLPLPASAIGQRLADLAFADHRNQLSVLELASRGATSIRTISRLFPAETGMTFKAWRQRARIVRAISLLSAGDPIARVSIDSGFASTAAFSFAFRQVTAMTPTAFMDMSNPV
ncbi:AraC family transcriptional regulator [Methylobacterium mesophilicum]